MLGIPVLVIVLVVWLALRGGSSDDSKTPVIPSPSASAPADPAAAPAADPADPAVDPAAQAPAPDPAATTKSSGPQACAPEALSVTLQADAVSYAAGAKPVFTFTVANTGKVECLVDAGDAQREVVITSGPARVWSSRDCAGADTQSLELLLDAGQSDQRAVQWDRVSSVPGCPGGTNAGAGTYVVSASLLGVTSAETVFVLE